MKKVLFVLFFLQQFTTKAQIIITVAGDGVLGHTGDGSNATSATLDYPMAVKCDREGDIYISELEGCRIRKIAESGIITTIAGTGSCGYNGDNISATTAKLNNPSGIAIDSTGNLYIADSYNNRIRKIDIATGIITTIAGNGTAGFGGDGGSATSGILNDPYDVCFDHQGNLYVADAVNYLIRKINTRGIITTFAGNGSSVFSGEGGPATTAGISETYGLCSDAAGDIFMAVRIISRVLKVDTSGILTTICGSGLGYNTGDGGPATAAQLNPERLVFDDAGNLYISCIYKNCVRMIDTFGIVHHIVGQDSIGGYNGDDGMADTSEISEPQGIDFDLCGNLYIADELNNRVRKVCFYPSCIVDSNTLDAKMMNTNTQISLYPSPAYTQITITSATNIHEVTITNLIGQQVLSQIYDTERAEINVAALPPGIYVVRVTDGSCSETIRKVVKE